MIPVMVARDSVTAEQGILVTSSSSSFFPFLFFTDFLSKFHSDQALHSPHTTPLQVIDIEEQIVVVVLQTIEHPWKSESGNRSRTIQNELVQMRKLSIQWPNLITRIYEEETRKKKRTNTQRSTSFRVPDTPWYTLLSFSPTTTTLTARLSLEKSWEPTKEREPDSKWGWM